MATTIPDYIIAIGASAGGLEEINTFFDHTPLDGVAYVIVQHLSANFKSRMVELLSKHSKLAVMEAENGMTVRSEEHTSELQSRENLVCRLLLEKKKQVQS